MSGRPRNSKPKKPKGPPVFGPEPPPPPPPKHIPAIVPGPSALPTAQEGETTLLEAAEQFGEQRRSGGNQRRKRNNPRKKLKGGTGFQEGHVDPPLHEADEGRYDSTLPFDQRMLRAIDEWRSLRALPFDLKLAADSVFAHFDMDVSLLRDKYGRQSLRGYNPDDETDEDDSEDEAEKVSARIFEIDETSEGVWAKEKFDEGLISTWLDDRANDGYTPILITAPQVMANFLRFLLLRDVFPRQKSKIKHAATLCELAKSQLPAAGALAKQLPTPFHKSLLTLFPSPTSELVSPIPDHDAPADPPAPVIPEFVSAATFVDDTTDLDLDVDTQPIDVSLEGWPSTEDDGLNSAIEEQKRRLEAIKKGLEQEAHALETWKKPEIKEEDAMAEVKSMMRKLGRDVEFEGCWKIEVTERSARTVVGWERIDKPQLHKPAEGDQPTERPLIRIDLGPHLPSFPVTAFSHSSTDADTPSTSLDSPISLFIDLSSSALKHLTPSRGLVFEADLTKIVFSGVSAVNEPIWILRSLHRVIPSYWSKVGERLRDEPGRQKDFEGGWEAPEGYEKHWQQTDGLPDVVGSVGEKGEAVALEASPSTEPTDGQEQSPEVVEEGPSTVTAGPEGGKKKRRSRHGRKLSAEGGDVA